MPWPFSQPEREVDYGHPKTHTTSLEDIRTRWQTKSEPPKMRPVSRGEREHPEAIYDVKQGLNLIGRGLSYPSNVAEDITREGVSHLGPILGHPATEGLEDALGNVAGFMPQLLFTRNPEFMLESFANPRYHGTPEPIPEFRPATEVGSKGNLWGPGLYTTNAKGTAAHYASGMRGGLGGTTYRVAPKNVKLFDLAKPLDFDEAADFAQHYYGVGWEKEVNQITGKSFNDLDLASPRGFGTEIRVHFHDSIRKTLEPRGYRGLTHEGGGFMGQNPHTVNIYWYPDEDISKAAAVRTTRPVSTPK